MNWAGCETDNSVITMRNDTCHVATVLVGRREWWGLWKTGEHMLYGRRQLWLSPKPIVALQERGPWNARSDLSMSGTIKFYIKSSNVQMLASN